VVKIFVNVNLIDGTGNSIIENAFMKVENRIIQEVGSHFEGQSSDEQEVIDLGGQFVMPGMIDCHTHITYPATANPAAMLMTSNNTDFVVMAMKNLEKFIENGVTYIRDVGDFNHISIDIREHLKNGAIKGPGVHSAGRIITMTGGHGHQVGVEADGVDEIRKATRAEIKAGADLIKVVSTGGVMTPGVDVNAYQFNVDELKAAVEEAHKAGRKVCTHCHGTQGVKNSILAGIDSIEHATILDYEAVEMMVKAGTYIVPTLVAPYFIVESGEAAGIPKFAVDKAKEVSQTHMKSLMMAYEAGVKIAMGTDAGTPMNIHGTSSAIELQLMVEAGMAPMDVIVAATKTSAELIGIESQYGTLESGKFADFLVLEENPLENIKTVQNLVLVYQNGQLIKECMK